MKVYALIGINNNLNSTSTEVINVYNEKHIAEAVKAELESKVQNRMKTPCPIDTMKENLTPAEFQKYSEWLDEIEDATNQKYLISEYNVI